MKELQKEKARQSLLRVDTALRDAADNFHEQKDDEILAKMEFDFKMAEAYLFLAANHSCEEKGYIVLSPVRRPDNAMARHRIPVGCTEDGDMMECSECGANSGELHKMGCSKEICPVCGNSLAICECWIGMY